jgi:hypothetical protein
LPSSGGTTSARATHNSGHAGYNAAMKNKLQAMGVVYTANPGLNGDRVVRWLKQVQERARLELEKGTAIDGDPATIEAAWTTILNQIPLPN